MNHETNEEFNPAGDTPAPGEAVLPPEAQPAPAEAAPGVSPEELEAAQAAAEADAAALAENLQAELDAEQAKNAQLTDQLLRAHAEVQNVRRRAEEEMAKARKFATEAFAKNLLPALDSLEAGLAAENATAEQLREGTEATLRQLLAALEKDGVLPVNPAPGERFDPTAQQAISAVPAEQPANTIVSVLQKGYVLAEHVLRPALVIVAASQ